jgi:hypothetical protein
MFLWARENPVMDPARDAEVSTIAVCPGHVNLCQLVLVSIIGGGGGVNPCVH